MPRKKGNSNKGKSNAHKPHKPAAASHRIRGKRRNRSGFKDTSYFDSPFNVMPTDPKDKSRRDKLAYLKSKGITGKSANKMAKSSKKLKQQLRSANHRTKNTMSRQERQNTKIIKFPTHIPADVPWKTYSKESRKGTAKPTGKSEQILPSEFYSLSQSAMDAFEKELDSFTQYVRLRQDEINARNSVVDHIKKLCCKLWDDDAHVEQFGSFATLDVCTFQSDIDLALWNVVKDKEISLKPEEEYIFGEKSGVVMSQSSMLKTISALNDQQKKSKEEQQKSSRKEEWKRVLEEVDFANGIAPGNDEKISSTKDCDEDNSEEKKDDDANGLFVIDRTPIQSSDIIDLTSENETSDQAEQTSIAKSKVEDDISFTIDNEGIKQRIEDESAPIKSDAPIILDDSSDDDDDVDKMNAFLQRQHAAEVGFLPEMTKPMSKVRVWCSDSSSADENEHFYLKHGINDGFGSDNSSCEENFKNCSDDETNFNLNISNQTDFGSSTASRSQSFGPTGEVRTKVVSALSKLSKHLWKSSFAQNLHVRKNAKVPIICMTTRYGFDSDVAIGGHNGMDTSQYVKGLVQKFDNFATVVLFLKILLQQMDLDKPFTGGLGSFRLYVLVANHFTIHQSLGGQDTAAEMLLGFLYRYGQHGKGTTKLKGAITCEGGTADFKMVNVGSCKNLFRQCYERLISELGNKSSQKESFIGTVIDIVKVKRERSFALNQSKSCKPSKSIAQSKAARNENSNSTKSTAKNAAHGKKKPQTSSKKLAKKKKESSKDSKEPRRSPRGALIPKRRFELEARLDGMDAIMQRGLKKRKNKKKQKRDEAITDFVYNSLN